MKRFIHPYGWIDDETEKGKKLLAEVAAKTKAAQETAAAIEKLEREYIEKRKKLDEKLAEDRALITSAGEPDKPAETPKSPTPPAQAPPAQAKK